MGQLNLKPYSLIALLDAAFSMYRRNFALLFWIAAAFTMVTLLAMQLITVRFFGPTDIFVRAGDMLDSMAGQSGEMDEGIMDDFVRYGLFIIPIYFFHFAILVPLSYGPLINAIHRNAVGPGGGFREAFRIGRMKYVRLILGYLLLILIICVVLFPIGLVAGLTIGLSSSESCIACSSCLVIMVVIPLILYALIAFSLYAQGIVIEGRGPLDALLRSARLIHGSWWRVFGIFIVIQFIASLIYQFSEVAFHGLNGLIIYFNPDLEILADAVDAAGLMLVQVFIAPILILGQTMIFYDLKVRREAYDLEIMVEGFQRPI